jgi:hypothetical protein
MSKPKPAKPKKVAKPVKVAKPKPTSSCLVSGFESHGKRFYVLRLTRDVGETLKEGAIYDITVKDGVLTLKPKS